MTKGPFVVDGVIVFESGLSIDGDGGYANGVACYGPPGTKPLDHLANAGKPGHWWGVVIDMHGAPIVQGPNDPAPGYFVSTTALADKSKRHEDPARYVNSCVVPYVSVPPEFIKEHGMHMGDVGMVFYADLCCGVIVSDVGPRLHYGEASIATADALGIPSSPRSGGRDDGVRYVLFPRSHQGWPRMVEDFQAQARDLFEAWGGAEKLDGVFAVDAATPEGCA